MTRHGIGLTNTEAQRKPVIQTSVGQIKIATAIQTVHQLLIDVISILMAEADQVQRNGRSQFEAVIFLHPIRELLCQFDMLPNVIAQSFHAIVTDYEP
jgi:hypothetical protein